MKGKNVLIASILSLVLMLGMPLVNLHSRTNAQVEVNFNYFHESLSPYGRWQNTNNYGPVWRPSGMPNGWQPYYNDGHWVYTDYGWTWVSDRPWGDVAFHYGSWYSDNDGWAWVPGYNWGPAWVTWRSTNRHVGWAPLPPTFSFTLSFGRNRNYYDDFPSEYNYVGQPVVVNNNYYVFVPAENITTNNLTVVRMHRDRNNEFIRGSRASTTFTVVNNHIANPGPRMTALDPIRRNRQHINQTMPESRLQPREIQLSRRQRQQRIDVVSPVVTRREARGVLIQEQHPNRTEPAIKPVREQQRQQERQQQQQVQKQQQQERQQQQQVQRQQQQVQRQQQQQVQKQQQQERQQQQQMQRQQQQQVQKERQQQQQVQKQQQQVQKQQERQQKQQVQKQQQQQRHLERQQQEQKPPHKLQ